ncbi:hypothetical protein NECAME_01828 [Necator americanus]|uniref:Sulfotransferase family protein n=1 Tax=Necator americanus TaxID=51031 RepID=W2TMY8_NECAM|nr:hypothetical protein NECAME_01828 [Necator americanus]ETN83029.1 hypothetical protein NECAME_01828 [Necator americanus]
MGRTVLSGSVKHCAGLNQPYGTPNLFGPVLGPTPLLRLFEGFRIAPDYDLATCQIEKVMTTVRDAIFCYLDDPIEFIINNRTISSGTWNESFCGWSNYRSNIDDVEREMGRKYKRFALIRNPFERFLSGYVDKCLNEDNFSPQVRCLACGFSMRCFVERLFHLLYGMYYNRTYLAREIWYVARHFAPQSWQCNFKKQLSTYDLIVYPESANQKLLIAKEIDKVLRKSNVPKGIRAYIKNETIKGRSPHSTLRTRARNRIRKSVMRDRYVRRVLAHIYYFDYIVFGFPLTPLLFD